MSLTDDLNIVDVWAGSAEPRLPEVPDEDMHLIAPLRVGRGYRLGLAYSVTDLRILTSTAGQLPVSMPEFPDNVTGYPG